MPCCLSMTNNERPTRLNDINELLHLQEVEYINETYKKSQAQNVPFIAMAITNSLQSVALSSFAH